MAQIELFSVAHIGLFSVTQIGLFEYGIDTTVLV